MPLKTPSTPAANRTGWNSGSELMLNFAEAAASLLQWAMLLMWLKVLSAINDVRDRAGVDPLETLTVNSVRAERRVELMYENHRFWDIKRWHIAEDVMHNRMMKALYPYYVANNDTWIFKKLDVGSIHDFKPYLYYIRINDDQINRNPGIIQNPGY